MGTGSGSLPSVNQRKGQARGNLELLAVTELICYQPATTRCNRRLGSVCVGVPSQRRSSLYNHHMLWPECLQPWPPVPELESSVLGVLGNI